MNIDALRQARDVYRSGESDQFHSPERFSRAVDGWIRHACDAASTTSGPFMLLALGGYGRRELYPFSDIDLLVCLPETGTVDTESLAAALFHPLWDSGFDVGHGVRTLAETQALAAADFEVLCSLLDARLLHGDPEAFDDFRRRIGEELVSPLRADLTRWLQKRHADRHRRFGETPHLLSPNIKEGRGGQRDLQAIGWLESIWGCGVETSPFLTQSERQALGNASRFISGVRVALHRLVRRKSDVLHLEIQPELAQVLGYGAANERGAVERFLSDLHKAMTDAGLLCRLCLGKAQALADGNGDGPGSDVGLDFSVLVSDPANILELFRHSAQSGVPIGWHTRRIIQGRFPQLEADPAWPRAIAARFADILCSPHAPQALEQMLEVGFLRLFLPEFADIEHLVQFDAYHRLPAGPHLVETVGQLASFGPEHEFLGGELAGLGAEPCLRWAALLHDISKGNGDHARSGAQASRRILDRLGFDTGLAEDCAFLVEHHLLLVHTATRRDLGEESVIHGLAATLGDVRRLQLLTLLTWADSVATGPKAWNPWVENLLRETYFKTRRVLEYGFLSEDNRVHRLSKLRDSLRSRRPEDLSVQEFEGYLSVMPPRYLMQTSSRRIVEHIDFVRQFRAHAPAPPFHVSWEHKPGTGSLKLTLISADRPGLFARVCAALARHGLSVLGAELCVWDDRTVVDVFWVTEPLDPLYVEETVEAFSATLARLFDDESELDRLTVKVAPRLKKVFALDQDLVHIHLDNGASDFHTVLSIQAPDVPGLLATVSLCLHRLGIDLVFAKIATQKDKAMDILHIREGGEKVPDGECETLARSLRLLIVSLYA
jgi:[protein-PII] uridylyltransferase